jgi:hypothetical protein
MAQNNLTPEQDIIVREFFAKVALVPDILEGNPADMITVRNVCLILLNYELTQDGRFIERKSVRTARWGTAPENMGGACEWEDDYRSATRSATDEPIKIESPVETSTSKPSTYSKIRKAIFPEDV